MVSGRKKTNKRPRELDDSSSEKRCGKAAKKQCCRRRVKGGRGRRRRRRNAPKGKLKTSAIRTIPAYRDLTMELHPHPKLLMEREKHDTKM